MSTARRYSDPELGSMLQDVESDLVERKESLRGDAPTGIREAVCAFANDLPDHQRPGVVFVGADDAGRPTGLPITDVLLRQLADIKTDGNIVPPPTLTVGTHAVAGHEVAVVTVQPADSPPFRYRGRTWIRVGPRRAVASLQDERILNEKRRHRESSFDAHPAPGARLADLDLRYFEEEYLPRAVDAATLEQNDRSTMERLASMKMLASADDPRPTVCGILILGKHPRDYLPGAYVQFLRIAGTALDSPIVDERLFDGPIGPLIGSLEDKLDSHNRTAVDVASGTLETRSSTHALGALRQLVRNAVMHRSYEGTNSPIHVYWYDDRIEINSPGGPYGEVSVENFGQPGFVAYRNPLVAEAMRVLNLVQRWGAGLPIARRELRANQQPDPLFTVTAQRIFCTVQARGAAPATEMTATGQPRD